MVSNTRLTLNLQYPNIAQVAYAMQGDRLSRAVVADLIDGSAPWAPPAGAYGLITASKPDGTFAVYDTLEDGSPAIVIDGSTVTLYLAEQVLADAGAVKMSVAFFTSAGARLTTFRWTEVVAPEAVLDRVVSGNYISILTATMAEAAEIFQQIKAAYGAPLTANAAAAMTDTSRVYVYTGTTTSTLTNGHWYYWDGTAWADGGVYNSTAFETDPTLTIAGAAADAKATGDALNKSVLYGNQPLGTLLANKYISTQAGALTNYNGWSATEFIPIVNTDVLIINSPAGTSSGKFNAFYTNSQDYIPGSSFQFDNGKTTINVPSGAAYYRMSAPTATMEQVTVEWWMAAQLEDAITNINQIQTDTSLLTPTFEALNSFTLVNGYINVNGGITGTSSSARKCTKYFNVPENCSFEFVGESDHQSISGIAFYNRRKRFISSLINSGPKGSWVSGITPPGAYFARISTANTLNYQCGFKITATSGYTGASEKESDLLIAFDNVINPAYIDATAGTDALNSGTKTQPFQSINYALELGYRKLFIKPDLYNENISLDGGEFEIIPWVEGQEYSKTTAPFRPKIKIIKGTKLETVSSGTAGIVQADYTAQSNSNVYKVFVSKTLAPTTQGSLALEYNALLVGDMPNTDTSSGPFSPYKQRLYTPVLTETELNNTEGTFWYNGSDTIKIHAWNNKPDGDYYIPDDDSAVGISLSNMTKVHLEDVKILGCYTDCLYLNYCDNVSANSCEFGYCAKGMGIGLDYTNARISDCHAYACSADGFNLHGYGYSEIVNCSAFYCGDDGISHHQGCSGFIDGGEWAFNTSGGITPSFGSQIDVRNVYAHHNSRGIQYFGQADANRNVSLSGSLSVDNDEYDIYVDMYVVDAWNCVCKNIFERYGSARSHINKYNLVILE